ncbi:hypothetical protein SPRG_11508 [Saprolegnia parasitica CBS 223.65]|uniref:Uncharacterized protein n=1 Tax=Saprolegnia parasitica (strain CBS 223.65) TaxID=695850 RepID=A0A067C2P7_SAPPC|nr:hypothetical protein SPRG_11508 [Saprolegnia parasitica CBS 223.65]KDO23415.1 hypothetical protein SPRG_11508 [Saprolegnia parasitica CBS 223.65]|eukprot:XP_012205903.1 hypothetical protein SPRG_11508 [Saprolegnia parasitica CBS 223.65]
MEADLESTVLDYDPERVRWTAIFLAHFELNATSFTKAQKTHWLVIFLVDNKLYELLTKSSCDFYSNVYVPEPHPHDPSLILTKNIDPDHVLKRFATHISTGFAGSFNPKLWREGEKPVLPDWWYSSKRDHQNVPDARLFWSEKVEARLAPTHPHEANLVRIWRNFFSVFDESGITDDQRLEYVAAFFDWLDPIVRSAFYARPMGQHYPLPIDIKKRHSADQVQANTTPIQYSDADLIDLGEVAARDGYDSDDNQLADMAAYTSQVWASFEDEETPLSLCAALPAASLPSEEAPASMGGTLPTCLIEALYLMGDGFRQRLAFLRGHAINQTYDAMTPEDQRVPYSNERFASSMNVESTFSLLNAIQKREGRGSVGKQRVDDVVIAMKKLLLVQLEDCWTKRKKDHNYDEQTYYKSIKELYQWDHPNVARPVKRGRATTESKSENLVRDDPQARANPPIRHYFKDMTSIKRPKGVGEDQTS